MRLIQLADIGVRSFINKSRRYISEDTFTRLKCFELKVGDLLVARMPDPLGRTCLLPEIEFRAITVVDVCVIRPNLNEQNSRYWEYVFNTSKWFNIMNQYASGTTRTRVSKKNLESILMPTPSRELQDLIVQKLDKLNNIKNNTTREIENLQNVNSILINTILN